MIRSLEPVIDIMKVAIIGASGKTGIKLIYESLKRRYKVVAVSRTSSIVKLKDFIGHKDVTLMHTPVISDETLLTQALTGCDASVVVMISVQRLKATKLISSLVKATSSNGIKRLVFTAGEVTAICEMGEKFTLRQRLMRAIAPAILYLTPYSMTDMLEASVMIHQQHHWEWTIMRAPTLIESPSVGYRFCDISEVTSKHALSREDYATCLLDSLVDPGHHRCTLTVVPNQ